MRPLHLLHIILYCTLLLLPCSVQAALIITVQQDLDFSKLARPNSGSQFVQLKTNSNTFTAGSTGQSISGTIQRGKYKIRRTGKADSSTISIDVIFGTSGVTGLTFGNVKGMYNNIVIDAFPAGGLPEPGNGSAGKILFVSPRATYTKNTPIGTFAPDFDIVVLFE